MATASQTQLLLQYGEMYSYENRLKTFSEWPFKDNCKCTPENMAKAGFIHCPSENEPDVVKCFFCLKELEGWEPQDDPWLEHVHRTSSNPCGFVCLQKDVDELTMEEFYRLELERAKLFLDHTITAKIHQFEEQMVQTRENLIQCFTSTGDSRDGKKMSNG
ncbi:baculoviral IAP repeat-containing protein 5.1-like [Protopterus annectens]|uniref:baculoviral IAP repeat-containing protein 5.1-like n=1 Tax=Protopterus annectens TaxID=7888 RepID=UPI001CFA87DC|nr:baculoviral IAP repeat-containing protein 5.1-like [Protopterus annectens]